MTDKSHAARRCAIDEAEGAVNAFSSCEAGLSPRGGFAHPRVIPRCHPRVSPASPVPPTPGHRSFLGSPKLLFRQTKQHLQSRLSPLQPSQGKKSRSQMDRRKTESPGRVSGAPGGAGEQGCGGSIKHLLGGYLGISQVLTDKLARLIRAIKAVWARVVS